MGEQGLADVAARLYALPFDEFVAARTTAAKEASAVAGQRSLAAEVRSLPKPSVAAWTVNMLAARQPETLRELAALGQSMRAAQSALDARELRRLGLRRRQLLGSAVQAAQAVAAQQGRKISGPVAADVEATLRAATADEGAAVAVQSGRLLRSLSADGVDVVELSGAVALPGLALPATAPPVPATDSSGEAAASPGEPARPRLRAVRKEPRRSTPSALERAREALKDAAEDAGAAETAARKRAEELAGSNELAVELSDTVRSLREQLSRSEQELKAATKRRELAAALMQQAVRAAARARRTEDLARERVLRLGNTPD